MRPKLLLTFQFYQGLSALEFLVRNFAKRLKAYPFIAGQFARGLVQNAKRADLNAIMNMQWHSGVKSDCQRTRHEWILGEHAIFQRIGNDKHLISQNRMIAEDIFSGYVGNIRSARRQHCQLIATDETNTCYGRPKQVSGKSADLVQARRPNRVIEIVSEDVLEPFLLIYRHRKIVGIFVRQCHAGLLRLGQARTHGAALPKACLPDPALVAPAQANVFELIESEFIL